VTLAQLRARAEETLRARLAERQTAQDALLALRADENLTETDAAAAIATRDAADTAVDQARAEVERFDAEIARDAEIDELATRTDRTGVNPPAPARITSEPEIYRKGGQTSYFRDLVRAQVRQDRGAFERLERNDRMVADQQARALTTVDGAGGDMVPPLWMVQDYVNLARAARVFADNVINMPLPPGTDSINIPKITGGTAVAEQTTQNTSVQNTDATTGAITAAVTTLAGQQVLSVQLIEQSPINMDEILLRDLALDYATKLDVFALNNSGTNKVGVLNVSSINAVTYTQASPTVALTYPKVADAIQRIHTSRFMPPEKIFMHPSRWAWFLAAVDSSGRPYVVPNGPAQNPVATQDGVQPQGPVGSLQGLPVYVDPSIPTNLGAGTNQDPIIVARTSDLYLWEGTPKAEAFREPLAANLSVLLRFYNYAAVQFGRYPKSISVINGTGLVAPTF
jgi:HK97 family phage major capsid protein